MTIESLNHQINNYTFTALKHEDQFSKTYRATQNFLSKNVLIKVLSPAISQNKKFLDRFIIYARDHAALNAKGIVRVLDCDITHNNIVYVVTEEIHSKTLLQCINENLISHHNILRVICSIAESLIESHNAFFFKHIITPETILIDSEGTAHLSDISIEAILNDDDLNDYSITVNSKYQDPLIKTNNQKNEKSDIYSLAAILWEATTGNLPEEPLTHNLHPSHYFYEIIDFIANNLKPDLTQRACSMPSFLNTLLTFENNKTPNQLPTHHHPGINIELPAANNHLTINNPHPPLKTTPIVNTRKNRRKKKTLNSFRQFSSVSSIVLIASLLLGSIIYLLIRADKSQIEKLQIMKDIEYTRKLNQNNNTKSKQTKSSPTIHKTITHPKEKETPPTYLEKTKPTLSLKTINENEKTPKILINITNLNEVLSHINAPQESTQTDANNNTSYHITITGDDQIQLFNEIITSSEDIQKNILIENQSSNKKTSNITLNITNTNNNLYCISEPYSLTEYTKSPINKKLPIKNNSPTPPDNKPKPIADAVDLIIKKAWINRNSEKALILLNFGINNKSEKKHQELFLNNDFAQLGITENKRSHHITDLKKSSKNISDDNAFHFQFAYSIDEKWDTLIAGGNANPDANPTINKDIAAGGFSTEWCGIHNAKEQLENGDFQMKHVFQIDLKNEHIANKAKFILIKINALHTWQERNYENNIIALPLNKEGTWIEIANKAS